MKSLLVCVLLFVLCILMIRGMSERKELKSTEYWNKLPKLVAIYGYTFPVVLIFLSEVIHGKILLRLISVVFIILFILLVAALKMQLVQEGYPEEVVKKYIHYTSITPLVVISVIGVVLYIIDLLNSITKQR